MDSEFLDIPSELLDHFLEDEPTQTSSLPAPCSCHSLPRGSCPTIIQGTVAQINVVSAIPGCPANMDSCRLPLQSPSFSAEVWSSVLGSYFDAPALISAFKYGWDLSFTEPPTPKDSKFNLPSADASRDVDKYIHTELTFGALLGPLEPSALPFRVYHSPLGTVHKSNSETRRTIVDCSQRGLGVNAFIPSRQHRGSPWRLTLPTTDTIAQRIKAVRLHYPDQPILMWKLDFRRYYRWFWIDVGQVRFLAIRWRGKTYLDLAFSFGNRQGALCAQRTSWAICHAFRTQVPPHPGTFNSGYTCRCRSHCNCGENDVTPYIDDMVGLSPKCLAGYQYQAFIDLTTQLGLELSQTPGHLSPPSERCTALGICFDLAANTVSLPLEKLDALIRLLDVWLTHELASERDLNRLAGRLLYASRVVRPGRIFLNRVLATKRRAALSPTTIILDPAFFADIRWWRQSLVSTNGISFLEHNFTFKVSLDASSNGWFGNLPGLAGYNHDTNEYFACPPLPEMCDWHISDLELLCHILAARLWGEQWPKAQVRGLTDNMACYNLVSNGRSRVDLRLRMARTFATLQLEHDYLWVSEWISTKDNTLPDALSRLGDPGFHQIFQAECRRLGVSPTQCPVTPQMFDFESDPSFS